MGGRSGKFSVGVDFGTNSVRAAVVSLENGQEAGEAVYGYRCGDNGVIKDGSDPNFARQDPAEYLRGLEEAVKKAVKNALKNYGDVFAPGNIAGIGVDTTGSTPIPVDADGIPLSFHPEFKNNPNALAWLWKDHTSFLEASRITEVSRESRTDYTAYSGGAYSSEWFFSKILRLARCDRKVYDKASSFVELCDFIPALLTGNLSPGRMLRSRCAAGHKAMFNDKWGGLPPQEFFSRVDPLLDGLRDKLYSETSTADRSAGGLCPEWARKLGLPEGTAVAAGAFDAHMGAVGAGIMPGMLVKIMGTSTCDMMIAGPELMRRRIKGVCGQVDGSIIPGYAGIEAGQSAVGDIFAWFRDQMLWGLRNLPPERKNGKDADEKKLSRAGKRCYGVLAEKAGRIKPGGTGLLCLDWLGGNRNILTDANLTGLITGLTLGTRPEEIFLALIEGTAYGAKVIMDRIKAHGVEVNEVSACGGLAKESPLAMRVYSSVLEVPIRVPPSSQTCALGAAVFGAVAGGCFGNVREAQEAMCPKGGKVYNPDKEAVARYRRLFRLYRKLHDRFGMPGCDEELYGIMKRLIRTRSAG